MRFYKSELKRGHRNRLHTQQAASGSTESIKSKHSALLQHLHALNKQYYEEFCLEIQIPELTKTQHLENTPKMLCLSQFVQITTVQIPLEIFYRIYKIVD